MGDTSPFRFPVAVQWDLGPERLKKVKNKLLLHFQSKKKSDGGECELRDMDCSQGHILIYFTQESVRDQVLQKQTHELQLPGGEKLKLNVRLPEARSLERNKVLSGEKTPEDSREKPSLPVPDSNPMNLLQGAQGGIQELLVIENVQHSCTPEILNMLLENISHLKECEDFHVEMIPEICSAVVTFMCPIDISTFIHSLSQHPRVNHLKLKAKLLEETSSIRVENLPPQTLEDHIMVFFESPKHGGGSVQEALLLPGEDAAVVTFCDRAAVKTVLEKKHVFRKCPISVYPYHPSLGVALYGKSGPCVTMPKPMEFPVSPYIMEFIMRDPQIKQNIEKKMEEQYCDITWPETDCPNPAIKLCISKTKSTHLRTMAKIVSAWENQVFSEFSLFISKYKVIEYKANAEVWEAIKEQVSSSVYERVLIKPDFAKEKVFLAGLTKGVTVIEQTFKNLIESTIKQTERKNQSDKLTVPMSSALYEIICKKGLKSNILNDFPDLKMDYDVSAKCITLYGLKEETLNAKCEILTIRQQLKSKVIQLNPHLINFLRVNDNDEMSCLLLIRHNMFVMLETDDDTVTLTGFSSKDLSEAEEQLKHELVCKDITADNKQIIQSPEWKSLTAHLCETFNSEKVTFLLEEFPQEADNRVVIAGLCSAVQDAYQQLHDFLEKNTLIQKDIQFKSVAVKQFLTEERKQDWGEIQKRNVKIITKNKSLSLHGPKQYVQETYTLIENIVSSLYPETLCINKPGAKKFCLSNEEMYVTSAKRMFNCVIYLQKDGEHGFIDDKVNPSESCCQVTLPDGIIVAVYKDDLTRHSVDVVVNAANEDLKHIGGLALDLLKAAGSKLQTDCDRIIREEGRLSVGESVITDAGNLPCKQVIHTVGPRWDSKSKQKCERLLKRAIRGSLELAAENGHNSIAIPAVSSGIFGCPVDLCAQSIVESIRKFVETQRGLSSIKRIHLVDTNENMITAFIENLKFEFEDQNIEASPKQFTKFDKMKRLPEGEKVNRPNSQMVTTKEGIIINVIQGNIQDAETDVIVNSVGKDLRLNNGGASRALFEKAGKKLQRHLDDESHGSRVEEGCVYTTDGCNLSCHKVIHVVVPRWDGGNGSSEKMLRQIVNTCLSTTEKNKLNSITFPAIGTGALGFPKKLVAVLMFDEIMSLSSKNNFQHLKEVNFILHPNDVDIIEAFSIELGKKIEANVSRTSRHRKANQRTHSDLFGFVTTPTLGVNEMKIGTIIYQVKTGDLTKENTDIIVNSTSAEFNLKTGVSKAILEGAGSEVEDECEQLGSMPNNGRIITHSGNLPCKKIIHVFVKSKPSHIKRCISDCLQDCEKLKVASVAFPAFGTGVGGVSPAAVADAMLDGVVDFASSKSVQHVQVVKVVVFQQQMLNDFYLSMKKKEGTNLPEQTSWYSRITAPLFNLFKPSTEESEEPRVFELKENIEPAIFDLCGESQEHVKKASSWLRDLILKEQHENTITDDYIKDFKDVEHKKLSELQKRFQVTISFQSAASTINVSGLTRDVLQISNEIQDMIKKIRDKKTMERDAELCSNVVEWRYHDGTKNTPFDKMTNFELEKAQSDNRQMLTIDIAGVEYTVNMEVKSASDSRGNQLDIERVPKNGQSIDLPSNWDPMNNDPLTVVPLNPGLTEYVDVQRQFANTCNMRIIKIERIQNKALWQNYQIKKLSMDNKNGNTNNEKRLFHGTPPNTVKTINCNGFNRSFAGMNAAVIGNGTYFAVNANYSSHNTYSKPDANGHKYMYLAQVLTGISCVGKAGLLAPPSKSPNDVTDLYDSVTDNSANPSMFVIFNDIQAYPEYLITFTP
ncbi:protein mono-ADP-ribosyltransferase PARP14-like isoform 2-T2 [Discoglossus pictus]